MMSGKLTVTDNQALLIMLGALGAAWGAVVIFFFGSSADSGRKTELRDLERAGKDQHAQYLQEWSALVMAT